MASLGVALGAKSSTFHMEKKTCWESSRALFLWTPVPRSVEALTFVVLCLRPCEVGLKHNDHELPLSQTFATARVVFQCESDEMIEMTFKSDSFF